LTVTKVDGLKVYIAETLASDEVAEINGKIWINNKAYEVVSATAGSNGNAYLSLVEADGFIEADMKIYPGDGGVNGKPVYSTVIVGKNAFGTSGDGNVEMINKPLGSAGTADPLNQRGTYGWKGYHFFKIIEQSKMCRIESVAEI
jgi:N4-gp56 family major capsid protein